MLIFCLFLLLFIFPKATYATGEFNLVQNISFSVNQAGMATVRQEINLTNNYSQIYAKEYQINLSGIAIQNVTGNDAVGSIINQVKTVGDNTNISLKFSKPVVGKDQTNNFFLNYNIAGFAKKKGNTWEIQFPVFDNPSDNQNIHITLEVPSEFGELSFASTSITSSHSLGDKNQYNFDPKGQGNKVLLVFGNHQVFDFTLKYSIKNAQSSAITTEIPIPPDTNYQTIIFKKIDPSPQNIVADADGNWLARYNLQPSQSLEIEVQGQAKIHPSIHTSVSQPDSSYLSSQNFWPISDPQITSVTQNLSNVSSIYHFVVNALNYNYDNINNAKRQGALNALNFPSQALCTEFTDLFVTLSRAKNIPAREIEGFAFSNNSKIKPTNLNSDVLHAWPEYYDLITKTWIQVDPTWEKTTNGVDYFSDLDLNHLTFVIHGKSSDYPPPPGSYRGPENNRSVFVDFASSELKPEIVPPHLSIKDGHLEIKNQNLFSLPTFSISIDDTSILPPATLPPLSTTTVNLEKQSFWKVIQPRSQYYELRYQYAQSSGPQNQKILNRDHFLFISLSIAFAIVILCLGGIIVIASIKSHEKNS